MARRLLPLALLSLLGAAAALLVANRRSPSRESLLPALRVVEQHEKQLDRAVGRLMPLPPEEERRIGEELDRPLASAGPGGPAEGLASELGRELSRAPQLLRFRGRYVFRVLPEDRAVNAYALPGGFVYLTAPLMRRFQRDPDALRFVLAHEIGHVELGHCADAYRASSWWRRRNLELLEGVAQVIRRLAELHFSEVQELEADRFAVGLMKSLGHDPRDALRAMDLTGVTADLDRRTRRDPATLAAEGLLDYFRTHPGSWERRGRLEEELQREAEAGGRPRDGS